MFLIKTIFTCSILMQLFATICHYLIYLEAPQSCHKEASEDPSFGCYSDTLGENMFMFPGAMLVSKNRVYKAVFQEDGNFVVYKGRIDAENALWASDTCGSDGKRLVL